MDERYAELRGCLGDMAGALAIHAHGERFLLLGLIDGGIGGGVDDDVAARLAQCGAHALAIGQIEKRPAERDDLRLARRAVAQARDAVAQARDDLALCSGDGDAHHRLKRMRRRDRAAAASGDPCPTECAIGRDRPGDVEIRIVEGEAAIMRRANRNSSPYR